MKKLFSVLLALVMVFTMTTMVAFADETNPSEPATSGDNAEGEEGATDENSQATTEGQEEGLEEDSEESEGKSEEAVLLTTAAPEESEDDGSVSITVLHTNDVHCGIDGYSKLAGYRDQLKEEGKNVLLVDAGDHVQGEAIGTLTKGEDIIKIMNGAGYDLAIPGNHEYDYQMDQFIKNVEDAEYPYISANFRKVDGTSVAGMESYKIFEVEGKKIAFVGISTPETYTTSTPVHFQDSEGNWVYTFNEDTADEKRFYPTIQAAIDSAKAAGADVVIGVGHTGMIGSKDEWNTQTVIANTTGLDAYIDGHSHEVVEGPDYEGTDFLNKDGKKVTYVQTGTKLANIGEMKIKIAKDGVVSIVTSLIGVDTLTKENEEVKALVDAAHQKVEDYLGEVVGTSEAELVINDTEGKRIVRKSETNLGDFNADAFKYITKADIALVNSGGVRKNLPAGDVTRKNLTDVNPFGNEIVKIEATGQQILDALEHGARNYPEENGGFLQVSGMSYEVYEDIPTPVVVDEQGAFLTIEEGKERRVGNVLINGEPIDPNKTYTVGGTSYILQLSGDGMSMFKDCKVVSDAYPNDSGSLVEYMTDGINGLITAAKYGQERGEGRILITTKPAAVEPVEEPAKEAEVPTKTDEKETAKPAASGQAASTTTSTSSGRAASAATATNVPKTGDAENATLYVVLFASALGTGVAAAYRRKLDKAA